MEKIRKNKKVIAVFLIPAVLIYLCFELIPVVMSVYFSFNDWPGLQAVPLKFVGFKNYSNLFLSLIHISEPTRQAEISYAVFCLKKKKTSPNPRDRLLSLMPSSA